MVTHNFDLLQGLLQALALCHNGMGACSDEQVGVPCENAHSPWGTCSQFCSSAWACAGLARELCGVGVPSSATCWAAQGQAGANPRGGPRGIGFCKTSILLHKSTRGLQEACLSREQRWALSNGPSSSKDCIKPAGHFANALVGHNSSLCATEFAQWSDQKHIRLRCKNDAKINMYWIFEVRR